MTDKFKQMVQLSDKTVLFFYSAFDLPVSFFFSLPKFILLAFK